MDAITAVGMSMRPELFSTSCTLQVCNNRDPVVRVFPSTAPLERLAGAVVWEKDQVWGLTQSSISAPWWPRTQNQSAAALRAEQKRRFFCRGVTFAVMSGVCYGLYTGFLTLAETQGPWGVWFGDGGGLSAFTVTFALAVLASWLDDL